MTGQKLPQTDTELLAAAMQRAMQRFQCSKKDATARLAATLESLLDGPEPHPGNRPGPLTLPPILPRDVDLRPPSQKKAKFVDFDLDATISSYIPHTLSEYAVAKIEDIEYVELWYFTDEGRREAGGTALQSIKATGTGASRNAIVDECLTWSQIVGAKLIMIMTANRVGWDQKLTLALAQFYTNLERLNAAGYKVQVIVLYHAVVRKQWHEALKGRGDPFNISIINKDLFARLENKLRDQAHEELRRQASAIPPPDTECSSHPTSHLHHSSMHLPTPYNNLPTHHSSPPSQLSREETIEELTDYRDRGRSRTLDRAMGRPRSSRSRSPKDRPPTATRSRKFNADPETQPLSACPICLSRKRHQIRKCQAATFWDGQHKTRCSRTEDGRIIDTDGRTLCTSWNQTIGCNKRSSRHIHECSGCGARSHGAQECGLAEE